MQNAKPSQKRNMPTATERVRLKPNTAASRKRPREQPDALGKQKKKTEKREGVLTARGKNDSEARHLWRKCTPGGRFKRAQKNHLSREMDALVFNPLVSELRGPLPRKEVLRQKLAGRGSEKPTPMERILLPRRICDRDIRDRASLT